MNKKIIIKTTLKKELIKSIIFSFIFAIIQSYIFYLNLNAGFVIGREKEMLKEIPSKIVIVLIPILFIVFMLFYLGKMVGKGYFDKGDKKK